MKKDKPPHTLSIGTTINKYVITKLLKTNEFDITYLAHETNSKNHLVVIKECFPIDYVMRAPNGSVYPQTLMHYQDYRWCINQFYIEGRSLMKIQHPNVVKTLNCFKSKGSAYQITAYIKGRTIEEELTTESHLTHPDTITLLLKKILCGITAIHKNRILHQNINPQNILLDEDLNPVIIEFGGAKKLIGKRSRAINIITSPGYTCLEQYLNEDKGDASADLYSIGAVMYRAIHGKPPPDALWLKNNEEKILLSRTYSDAYHYELLWSIDKSLKMETEQRYQTACEWNEDLNNILLTV